ncbi:hypothetical protein DFH09DRAFT_1096879 [Mycena vulgaris]|nr:hypothetical protein DFH09DRAFT_1096879 [Mycena vulgaris]
MWGGGWQGAGRDHDWDGVTQVPKGPQKKRCRRRLKREWREREQREQREAGYQAREQEVAHIASSQAWWNTCGMYSRTARDDRSVHGNYTLPGRPAVTSSAPALTPAGRLDDYSHAGHFSQQARARAGRTRDYTCNKSRAASDTVPRRLRTSAPLLQACGRGLMAKKRPKAVVHLPDWAVYQTGALYSEASHKVLLSEFEVFVDGIFRRYRWLWRTLVFWAGLCGYVLKT